MSLSPQVFSYMKHYASVAVEYSLTLTYTSRLYFLATFPHRLSQREDTDLKEQQ